MAEPFTIGILTPDGLQPAPYSATSLADAADKEPDGVYTVGRTFRRDRMLLLDVHLDRLEESARLENIALHLDRKALRSALKALIDQSGNAESRFRITVPRTEPDHLTISLESFQPIAQEVIDTGVRVITLNMARHNPAAKSTAWMHERKDAIQTFPPGVYEGILVGPGHELLEGTTCNFYAVMDGILRTAGEGVLSGIAQRVVFEVAPTILPVEKTPILANELWAVEESFLTSASRGIVPIVMINTQIIGDGMPGPVTRSLRAAYDHWVETHLEPLA